MYNGVARSSYRQHSCDDVTKLGLCDWFTNELTDWRRRRRRRRKEITYETLGLHLVQKYLPAVLETAFQNYYYLPFVIKCHSVGSMAHPYDVLKLICTY